MTPRLLRVVFVFEFLVALVAIFTAWSEIGGQAALDAMTWFWKFGLGLLLAATVVGYSSSIAFEDGLWTLRSTRWLAGMLAVIVAMGFVTYFFQLQVDSGDGDESSTMSRAITWSRLPFLPS